MKGSIVVEYPSWVASRVDFHRRLHSDEEKMGFVIELAQQQAMAHTGGPFTAAIFQQHENRVVSVGMNLVLATKNPIAHAPIVALMKACEAEGSHDLGSEDGPQYEIFVICPPCGMCTEALLMSGIKRLVYAAPEKAAEALHMERGEPNLHLLREAGVSVEGNILSGDARQVLRDYERSCGDNYNPRRR